MAALGLRPADGQEHVPVPGFNSASVPTYALLPTGAYHSTGQMIDGGRRYYFSSDPAQAFGLAYVPITDGQAVYVVRHGSVTWSADFLSSSANTCARLPGVAAGSSARVSGLDRDCGHGR